MTARANRSKPWAMAVIAILMALKLALLFVFALNGRFVMDEFEQLGWAKYLGHGFFTTIWPAKAVGYAVFFELAHAIGWDARSILIAGRVETALLACGTVALVYATARALGHERGRALAIVLVLLAFSNFLERSYRTIAEPVATFFAVAALYVAVRGRADQVGRILAAGALGGLAFLCTQKALYFDLALWLALAGDAALRRQFGRAVKRGAGLVLGWLAPVVVYCLAFGGRDPLAVAQNLLLGPTIIAGRGGGDYGGLRQFVVQTLQVNALLYLFCFAGMALALRRIRRLDQPRRIALIFSLVITVLVFAHDQPWPYVFIMALPFAALWALEGIDALAAGKLLHVHLAWAVLGIGIAASFVRNGQMLRIDNRDQLALVARAEALVGPDDVYFDGIGMLPNRREPSTLWIDRHYVLKTLAEKERSDAYRIFASAPPKLIIWSYRMEAIAPVVGPLIAPSYVRIAPNIHLAGRRLERGKHEKFNVPLAGDYELYSHAGFPLHGYIAIRGRLFDSSVRLMRGPETVTLLTGAEDALLLPKGSYEGKITAALDDPALFANVYD
jgi:hypothetical protein